jgi:hypothetical protein
MLVDEAMLTRPSQFAATAALDDFLAKANEGQVDKRSVYAPDGEQQPKQASTLYEQDAKIGAYALHDTEQTLIIDSGASAHYVIPAMPMANERPCLRKLAAAGGTVLRGTKRGTCGVLQDCIAVEGLTSSLCSVGNLVTSLNVSVISGTQKKKHPS